MKQLKKLEVTKPAQGLTLRGLGLLTLAAVLGACNLFPPSTPGVASVNPASGATNVGLSSSVSASLTLPGSSGLDVQTLTDTSVTLTDASGTAVPAARTFTGNTLVLDPTASLSANTAYTFNVTADVKTSDGTALRPFTSTFTTGTSDTGGSSGLAATPNRVVFTAGSATSDTRTLTLTNAGATTVNVSGLSISGASASQFSLADSSAFSLAPGATRDLSLTFKPNSLGPQLATLNVQSNDPAAPSLSVPLGGLGVKGQGGANEPSLQWILDTYGLKIDTGDLDPSTTGLTDTPTNGPVGDEVAGQTFTKASASAPVTAEVLATFAVENNPVLEFGYYAAGQAAARTPVFDIQQTPTLNAQRLGPVVSGSTGATVSGDTVTFDPGMGSFGLYSFWPTNRFFTQRYVYTEDTLNTFPNAVPHNVRTYPLVNPDGTTEPNAYVVATDEFGAAPNDYNDVVVILRNVVPAGTLTGPVINVPNTPPANGISGLNVSNALGLPYNDRMTLQKIQNTTGKFCDPATIPNCDPTKDLWAGIQFPTTGTVNLRNTGSSTLQLSLSFQNDNLFVLPGGESTLTLQPGQSYQLKVEFSPKGLTKKGVYPAGLLITSGGQSAGLELAGLYMLKPEANHEVYFAPLVNKLFGYTTKLGEISNGGLQSPAPDSALAGEEVRSAYWEAANPGSPVTALQIAAFYPCCGGSAFPLQLVSRGSSSPFATMRPAGTSTQSIYPRQQNGNLTQLSANASGPFEVRSANYSSNPVNGVGRNLGVRFWPLRDRSGNLVADTYIVAQDFVAPGCKGFGAPDTPTNGNPAGIGSNCDYQDNLYIMGNIRPVN